MTSFTADSLGRQLTGQGRQVSMQQIRANEWTTNGTPHSLVIEESGGEFQVSYSNGYCGNVAQETFTDLNEAEKYFSEQLYEIRLGNGI